MGNFIVKTSKIKKAFEFNTDALMVAGHYTVDEANCELQVINASCYRKVGGERGSLIGTFNGYNRGGEFRYTFSEMNAKDSLIILDAVNDIEQSINDSI